jgi:outer membrane protein assembly factor BamE
MAEPMRQRPIPRFLAALALAGVLTLAAGCLYRMDIKQGNLLDPTQVLQLQNGMTKSQVRFLLGTPMVPNGFDSDRWNYYYYEKTRFTKEPLTRRVTVWFKDDKVDRFERPDDTESAAAAFAAANAEAAAEANAKAVLPPPNMRTAPTGPATPRQPRH